MLADWLPCIHGTQPESPYHRTAPSSSRVSTVSSTAEDIEMLPMFYYENYGTCCKALLKYKGYPCKILLFPDEGWAMASGNCYWILSPLWWSRNRFKVIEVSGSRRKIARARIIGSGLETIYISGSFKKVDVYPDFRLELTTKISRAEHSKGYFMTGNLERGDKSTNLFQITDFAVIRQRGYDVVTEDTTE